MPRKTIPPELWDEIGHHWRLGHMTVVALADRYGLNPSSIYAQSRRRNWPPRQQPRDDPGVAREALLADLTFEVRQSLARLRADPPDDTLTEARDRTRLIREYQRSLAVLVTRPAAQPGAPPETLTLDLEAAERVVLDRLSRLDLAELEAQALADAAAETLLDPPASQTPVPAPPAG